MRTTQDIMSSYEWVVEGPTIIYGNESNQTDDIHNGDDDDEVGSIDCGLLRAALLLLVPPPQLQEPLWIIERKGENLGHVCSSTALEWLWDSLSSLTAFHSFCFLSSSSCLSLCLIFRCSSVCLTLPRGMGLPSFIASSSFPFSSNLFEISSSS